MAAHLTRWLPHSQRTFTTSLVRCSKTPNGAASRSVLPTGISPSQRASLWRGSTTKIGEPIAKGADVTTLDKSLSLSQGLANVKTELQFTRYNASAKPVATEKLTKAEIAKTYGITTRDLRSIDMASLEYSNIQIRRDTIIMELLDLRLIVRADEVLLIHIPGFKSHDVSSVFCYNLENKGFEPHVGGNERAKQPFELRVLDTALASVTATLHAEYLTTKASVMQAVEHLQRDMHNPEATSIPTQLQASLETVRQLSRVGQQARLLSGVLQGILNDNEDMAEAYLSDTKAGRPHSAEDHQEVEYLLESYFKSSEDTAHGVESLVHETNRTERTIQSVLSVRRNQLMVLEVKMEVAMVGLASVTFVAGLYGMNVPNYLEEVPWAFPALSLTCLGGIWMIWRLGRRMLWRIQASR